MKKITAIIICASLLLGIPQVFAEEEIAPVQGGAVNQKHVQAIEFLADLGLTDKSPENPNEPALRSELAELAVRSMGSGVKAAEDTPFRDVKSDNPASGYIREAYSSGIMKGASDLLFEPNGNVDPKQMITVMVRMTGYGAIADAQGGDYAAYAKTADRAGLRKGVSFKSTEYITFGEMAYAVRCALEADMMEFSGYGSDGSVFDRKKGSTLLENTLKIRTVKGQVTANYFTGLAGKSSLNENQIEAARTVYTVSKKNAADFLGKAVKLYIDDEDIVRAIETDGSCDEVTVKSDKISAVLDGSLKYENENGGISSVNYRADGYLIYNGEAKLAWSKKDIERVTNGTVRLIDADRDGTYEIIFADRYADMLVSGVSAEDETVSFKTGSALAKLDLSSEADIKYDLRDSSGNTLEIKDIPKDSLLSAAMSESKGVCRLYVSTERAAGTCTAIDGDSVEIDGASYPMTADLRDSGKLKLDTEGTFYINFLGYAAAFDYGISYEYGYLIKIGKEKGISPDVRAKLFTKSGELVYLTLEDKVKFNDSASRLKASDVCESELLVSGSETREQLVAYTLNAGGKISRLSTAADGSGMTYAEKTGKFTCDAAFTGGAADTSTRYIGSKWKMFGGRYLLDDDTVIFLIPSDLNDEEKFSIISYSGLANETFYGSVKLYDEDENNRVKAVVIPADGVASIDQYSPVGIVKNTKMIRNADGDFDCAVTVVSGGKDVVLTSENSEEIVRMNQAITDSAADDDYAAENGAVKKITLEQLDKGDIICYNAAADGKLRDAEVILRAKTAFEKEYWPGTDSLPSANYFYRMRYAAFGTVDAPVKNGARVTVPSPGGAERYTRVFPIEASAQVLKYNSENGVTSITADEIFADDKIFVYAGSDMVKLVVVYR